MNKRIREKVAARTNDNQLVAKPDIAKAKPLAEAVKDARLSAMSLGRAVVASAKESAGEAVEHVKSLLVEQEERAEHLLEKLPAVGPKAAKKLHDMTHPP